MNKQEIKSNGCLVVAALIWGFAFVAQRVGSRYMPPFSFNAVRFLLGGLSLLPLMFFYSRKSRKGDRSPRASWAATLPGALLAGTVLFCGVSLQQIGMAGTTAGKAGFITDLYIVMVPVAGLFFRRRVGALRWVSIGVAVTGLYFISVTGNFTVSSGDLFELAGAFFWTIHILVIDRFSKKTDALRLSFIQFIVCSLLSFVVSFGFERVTPHEILPAAIPLLYGGICSVGVAYTLQTLGQRHSKPSHSAIILSLESVFSCLGGALILHENLGARGCFGCALMVTGMVLSQLDNVHFSALRAKSREKAIESE